MIKVTNFSDIKLDELINKLVPVFHPTKMYLFGSRAMGTANNMSDYDLMLIVKDSDLSRQERMVAALEAIWGCGVPVDVFVYTEAEFADWKDEFSSIPHTVLTEGLELKVG